MAVGVDHYMLRLSQEGDSVELINLKPGGNVIPEQENALACKTHQAVLEFFQKLATSPNRCKINFYHDDNKAYSKHTEQSGESGYHLCPLDTQIDFIQYKMQEEVHGVRRSVKSSCILL